MVFDAAKSMVLASANCTTRPTDVLPKHDSMRTAFAQAADCGNRPVLLCSAGAKGGRPLSDSGHWIPVFLVTMCG